MTRCIFFNLIFDVQRFDLCQMQVWITYFDHLPNLFTPHTFAFHRTLTWALYTMCTPWKMICFEKSSKKFRMFSTWIVYGKPRSRMQFFADPLVITCCIKWHNNYIIKPFIIVAVIIIINNNNQKKSSKDSWPVYLWL